MDTDSFIKSQAALLAWRDGHRNGVNGMLGVLLVLRRRVVTWFSGNWLFVIEDAFGSRPIKWPDVRDPDFQTLLQLVDSVYDSTRTDKMTNEATQYFDITDPTAPHPAQLGLIRVAQIGTLEFYRTA